MDVTKIDLSLIRALNFTCPFCYLESGGEMELKEEKELSVFGNENICLPSLESEESIVDRLPEKIGKKFENFRQTVIRHFKKAMRKLERSFQKFYYLDDPSRNKQWIKKTDKIFSQLYPTRIHALEDKIRVFSYLRVLDSISTSHFEARLDSFKSCNNSYVTWFFSKPEIKRLYALHVSLTSPDIYYKLLGLKEDIPQDHLYNFIYEIAN